MSLVARGVAYLAALMLAFGGVAPWVVINGEPAITSPDKVLLVWGIAIAAAIATVFRKRRALSVLAVVTGAVAVYAIWNLPGFDAVATPPGRPSYSAATGSAPPVFMVAALLLYLASWLPVPRSARVVPADAET